MLLYSILFQSLYIICGALRPCIPRNYGYGGIVCVCNATYCDDLDVTPEHLLHPGYYLQYESKNGDLPLKQRLVPLRGNDHMDSNITTVRYNVNPSKRYQEMMGFGGAVTDAVGINVATLSPKAQEMLLRQYFAPEGISYSFVRIPIAGTDFSTRNYTYDDGPTDETLSRFNLTKEDLIYKIPLLKRAMELSKRPIKLLTTTWSAPAWMTELRLNAEGYTKLKESYYQVFAEYFIKFLDAYKAHGLQFWALTPQNEPIHGSLVNFGFNSLGWLPTEQRQFVAHNLGPTLRAKGYENIKIMIVDDQRVVLPMWVETMMEEENLGQYVSGVAVHWYSNPYSIPGLLTLTHAMYPNLFIMYTEAAILREPGEPAVRLGNWQNAEKYALDIIQDTNHWSTGWIDWNIALNEYGGPNWANNNCDSAVIVNGSANEFYKQPMFYALAHFSKFVPPGSHRVELTTQNAEGLEAVAFITPRNITVIVLLNRLNEERRVTIDLPDDKMEVKIPAHSIETLLYNHEYPQN